MVLRISTLSLLLFIVGCSDRDAEESDVDTPRAGPSATDSAGGDSALTFDVFYTCYSTQKTVEAQSPIPLGVAEIRAAFGDHLREKDDFLGIVDSEGVTLQFMVEDDGSYWTEIPIPKRQGSVGRALTQKEVTHLLQHLPRSLRPLEKELHLEFRAW